MHPTLHPKQQEIVTSRARFKIIRAGRRSGKTIVKSELMLFKAVTRSIKYAKLNGGRAVIFIAPTQKQARTIIWETFRQRLGKDAEFFEGRLEIRIKTEDNLTSTIFIGGWENRENYRGMPNVIHIEFDEVDTMKDFFIGWQEIFRSMLIDTGGSAGFGGTPKKQNPNLRRLEKEAEGNPEWATFHFTTYDNPFVPREEIDKARREMDNDTFREEIMAEHVDNVGALFRYDALIDIYNNAITKDGQKYMTIDVADDGGDKTIFSIWDGLEEIVREEYSGFSTQNVIDKARELAAQYQVPYSNMAVDAIGVGAGVASSRLLDGIIGFKSSYSPIKTDLDIVRLPNVGYTKDAPLVSDYKNLRSQCLFTLAHYVNNHGIASRVSDVRQREAIIEELSNYQDVSTTDGKRMATPKEKVKEAIGHSPDASDTWIMRMYFVVMHKMIPQQSQEGSHVVNTQKVQFMRNRSRAGINSNK